MVFRILDIKSLPRHGVHFKTFVSQMRRKSDLPNQKPPPETPMKQTSHHIHRNKPSSTSMNTPSRLPTTILSPYNDSPPPHFPCDALYSDFSSPIKQPLPLLPIPFDHQINQQCTDTIFFISIQQHIFVAKKCKPIELQIYALLNPNIKQLQHLSTLVNHHVMPTLVYNDAQFILMPFCTPLDTLMYAYSDSDMPIPMIKQFTNQLFSALCYIHQHGILHGDVKPQNILIFDAQPSSTSQSSSQQPPSVQPQKHYTNRLYLSDFSVGQMTPFDWMEYGDPKYFPPEGAHITTVKADVFSAGLVIYELLENIVMPLNGDLLYKQLRENQFKFTQRQDVHLECIIRHCCMRELELRWTAMDVLKYMKTEE